MSAVGSTAFPSSRSTGRAFELPNVEGLKGVPMFVVGSTASPSSLLTGCAFGLPNGAGLNGMPGGPGKF